MAAICRLICLFAFIQATTYAQRRGGLIQLSRAPHEKDQEKQEGADKSPADAYQANNVYDPVLKLNQNIFAGNVADQSDRVSNWMVLWCPYWWEPCQQISPHFEKFAQSIQGQLNKEVMTSKVRFARVDCATEKPLCNKYGVEEYPTVQHFKGGHLEKIWTGRKQLDPDGLSKFLEEQLQDASAPIDIETAAMEKQRSLTDYLVPGDRAFDVSLVVVLAMCCYFMSRAAEHCYQVSAKMPPRCMAAEPAAAATATTTALQQQTTTATTTTGIQSLMPQEWRQAQQQSQVTKHRTDL
jgi:thioredoxin-like negative regulator of GroEL